jgi:tetratricopeptide (TPR) repeat protein
MSLLTECRAWSEQAICALDEGARGTPHEIGLQWAFGHSLMFTEGNSERALSALNRGLELAHQRQELALELRMLGGLQVYHQRMGDYHASMALSQRSQIVAEALGDPVGRAAADSIIGLSHHLLGNHPAARLHLERALADGTVTARDATRVFGSDYRLRAQVTLGVNLWLQGDPMKLRELLKAQLMLRQNSAIPWRCVSH